MNIREDLQELRRLRMWERECRAIADKYMDMACSGMGRRRATDMGGTGHFPVADYALIYGDERKRADDAEAQAQLLVQRIWPLTKELPEESRRVIGLYYREARSWAEVAKALGKSQEACWGIHRRALSEMEGKGWKG